MPLKDQFAQSKIPRGHDEKDYNGIRGTIHIDPRENSNA
jgi:hypothetical protein